MTQAGSSSGTQPGIDAWVRGVASEIADRFHPQRIVVFGSRARGDAARDSDLDILVVFDHVDTQRRHELVAAIMAVVRAPVPVDVVVTDLGEFEAKKDVNGSMIYWPAHEGVVVHEHAVA